MTIPLVRVMVTCRCLRIRSMTRAVIRRHSSFLTVTSCPSWSQIKWYASQKKDINNQLVRRDIFQEVQTKNREVFLEMLNIFKEQEIKRRSHVEFIYSALKHMKEFGVEKDLEIYKSLIDVLPKGKMVARNMFQAEFMHYPKQQQCVIDILEQMEENGVMPDWDMEDQLVNIFGRRGYPVRRYWRMMYWMPKFKHASPWHLPTSVPNDPFQLAMLAIQRITSVDVNTNITTFKTSDVKDSIDDTWLISGQSPDQIRLLDELPDETPLFVEGRFRIWIRNFAVTYFILKADICRKIGTDEDTDDVRNMKIPFFTKPSNLPQRKLSVHEQEDGIILAVCSTGTSSRDSVLTWVRLLEKNNPRIAELPIIFTLKAPPEDTSVTTVNPDGTADSNSTATTKNNCSSPNR